MGFGIVEIYVLLIWFFCCVFLGSYPQGRIRSNKQFSDIFYLTTVMLLLALMSMFRAEMIGKDTFSYMHQYVTLRPFNFVNRMEPGFILLSSILKLFSSSPASIIVITGGITILLYYIFIKRNSNWYFISVVLFLCLGFFDSSLNTIRQSLAVGLTCLAFPYIVKGDLKKFLIFTLLATSFHTTAIIFLPSYFFRNYKINRCNFIVFIISLCIIYFSFSKIAANLIGVLGGDGYYFDYIDSIYGESGKIGILFQFATYLLLLLVVFYIRAKIGLKRFSKAGLELPFILTLIGTGIVFISYNMSIVSRLAQYYVVYFIILVPNALKLIQLSSRVILAPLTFISVNVYYWIILILRPYWNAVYPYFIR